MAKPSSHAIGKMKCFCCGELFTIRQSEAGTLNLTCPDCDLSAYAKPGTAAHGHAMKRITLKAPDVASNPVATSAPAPTQKAPPTPPPARKNASIFG